MTDSGNVSNDYILDKAIHEAIDIIIKPCTSTASSQCPTTNISSDKSIINSSARQPRFPIPQNFLLMMSTIAWDFLNVSNVFRANILKAPKKIFQDFSR